MSTLDRLDPQETLALVRTALDEDLRYGPDITSVATVPEGAVAKAAVVTRSVGTVAGVDVGLLVLDEVIGAGNYEVLDRVADGTRVQPGDAVLTVNAPTRGLLTAERTMLNLMCTCPASRPRRPRGWTPWPVRSARSGTAARRCRHARAAELRGAGGWRCEPSDGSR